MPDDNNTPTRPIRIDLSLWRKFGELVGPRNRSEHIREYIRWMLHEPGAKAPRRPVRRDDSE